MSKPQDAEDLDPNELRRAINLLHQELPEILGSNYRAFKEKLDSLLSHASNKELLALFAFYPDAHDRLRDLLNFFSAGHGLYGNPISKGPSTAYYCATGQHYVAVADVQERNAAGRPICPSHGTVMR